jgi:hypothetical protein
VNFIELNGFFDHKLLAEYINTKTKKAFVEFGRVDKMDLKLLFLKK